MCLLCSEFQPWQFSGLHHLGCIISKILQILLSDSPVCFFHLGHTHRLVLYGQAIWNSLLPWMSSCRPRFATWDLVYFHLTFLSLSAIPPQVLDFNQLASLSPKHLTDIDLASMEILSICVHTHNNWEIRYTRLPFLESFLFFFSFFNINDSFSLHFCSIYLLHYFNVVSCMILAVKPHVRWSALSLVILHIVGNQMIITWLLRKSSVDVNLTFCLEMYILSLDIFETFHHAWEKSQFSKMATF